MLQARDPIPYQLPRTDSFLAGVILLTTLTILASISLYLTSLAVLSYIFYRLAVHFHRTGLAGLPHWFSETKALLLGGTTNLLDSNVTVAEGGELSGAAVLIDEEGVKVEGK